MIVKHFDFDKIQVRVYENTAGRKQLRFTQDANPQMEKNGSGGARPF
jgi:hypothetical protein